MRPHARRRTDRDDQPTIRHRRWPAIQMRTAREKARRKIWPGTKLTPGHRPGRGGLQNLDADGDGELNLHELSLFPLRPPDLELLVRLGKRQAKEAAIEIMPSGDRPSPLAALARVSKEGLALDVGVTRCELRPTETTNPQGADAYRQQYTQQFKALDRDGNGYLDMDEVQRIPFFRSAFKIMDKDGDGQLFEKEMIAYFEGIQGLRTKAQSGNVMITITEQGRGMFDLLDTDRDGRLSSREMRMQSSSNTFDRNKDGYFTREEPAELPCHAWPRRRRPFRGRAGRRTSAPSLPTEHCRPLWFRKMDRNRDGDVSRRVWER